MDKTEAVESYAQALKQGQKEYKELLQKGLEPYPQVLDDILGSNATNVVQDIGVIEIPADRIIGTKTAGRITAFTPTFKPLLSANTEFAYKWVSLCADHLSDEGIREPILCYEYLGNFYVQEGNKRVSVLRYFDAPRIPGRVLRILPEESDEPEIRAYYEFLEFYKASGIYAVQFRQPGGYAKLLSFLGKEPGEAWTEREQKTFRAYFQYFKEAFLSLKGDKIELSVEEALLLWLRVYPFQDLGELSADKLKKAMQGLWEDMISVSNEDAVQVETVADESGKTGLMGMLLSILPEHLNVAFVHQMHPDTSGWAKGHEMGAQYLQTIMPHQVTVRNYYHGDSPKQTRELLEQAVAEGAEVVFTTAPKHSRETLKAAVKYPKVRFLNCSVDAPYSSVRTYYSRIYEGKFITGAIAGAMSENDNIGYIGSYPIFGVPASINAFALGAQLTNPRAKIELHWSCQGGYPVEEFVKKGVHVISNRDVPISDKKYLTAGNYGTYLVEEDGTLCALGSPCWNWGKFYEHVIRAILNGAWDRNRDTHSAVNYWWGMDSGVIDVTLSEKLPEGLRQLTEILRKGLQTRKIDPFRRRIVAQDGSIKNTGDRNLTTDELLHMDWLCDNVIGSIPQFDEILPFARDTVRELGIYRESIPLEKEGTL